MSDVGRFLPDPHAALRERAMQTALHGPAHASAAIRTGAAQGVGLPEDMRGFVEKIHRHAYRVTAEDVATLQARYGDDQMFEIIVSAALGASEQRLVAALGALEDACD